MVTKARSKRPKSSIFAPASFTQMGHRFVRLAFVWVIFIFIAAPLLALSWRSIPFPGFLVEQTLVVNDSRGYGWAGLQAGIHPGERIIRIGGLPVTSSNDYYAALKSLPPGQPSVVFTILRDGSGRLYPEIRLSKFPAGDFISLFWLPYFVGLVYLGIGIWIYFARGNTRSGLALSIFCTLTAAICALFFDIATTHFGTISWMIALSLTSSALISLAMCFPQEWPIVRQRLWVLAVPYGIALPLIIWNLSVAYDADHPWAYYDSWGATYRAIGLAILFFIGVMLYHAYRSPSPVVRRQARIVLLGSGFAFIPIMVWFFGPLLNAPIPFNPTYFLPPLILFPLSIGTAILRYRLWEIDTLVNRTIVYGLLTAVLAGIFTAMIAFSQRLFIAITGEKSDAAIVLTTLVVGSAIAPIRTRLQTFVDRQFKDERDHTKTLQAFGSQVQAYIQLNSSTQLTWRLLNEAAASLHADSGALAVVNDGQAPPRILHTYRQWRGRAMISLPVEHDDHCFGYLMLGPKEDGKEYTQQELRTLKQVSSLIAAAMQLNELSQTGQARFFNPSQ